LIARGQGGEEELPPALLSLSGDGGFRRNALASSSEEGYVFDGLFPGSFFLRPLLKEYSFAPASMAIELEPGAAAELSFVASRISYSALGSVASLAGKPEEGISVEARAESGNGGGGSYYEEAVSDAEGKYRLRGLKPNTVYSIKVCLKAAGDGDEEEGTERIERVSPRSYELRANASDIAGLDFVLFDRPLTTIVTGTVEGPELRRWRQHLAIRVVSFFFFVSHLHLHLHDHQPPPSSSSPPPPSLSPSSSSLVLQSSRLAEQVIPLPLSHFFEVQGLARGKYTVQLVLGLSGKTHGFESDSAEVDLAKNPQIHIGPLRFAVREEHGHNKPELASAPPVAPVLVGLLVAFFSVFAMQKTIKEGASRLWPHPSSASSAAQPKKDKPLARKRTY
jgi:hypothetical protein